MDKIADSDSADVGSIPAQDTRIIKNRNPHLFKAGVLFRF